LETTENTGSLSKLGIPILVIS